MIGHVATPALKLYELLLFSIVYNKYLKLMPLNRDDRKLWDNNMQQKVHNYITMVYCSTLSQYS